MANEKIGLSVPQGCKSLVKAIAAVMPPEYPEGLIWAWGLYRVAKTLVNSESIPAEGRALIESRVGPLEDALKAADTRCILFPHRQATIFDLFSPK